jgi:tRNA (mo5U34)-methyltransferase
VDLDLHRGETSLRPISTQDVQWYHSIELAPGEVTPGWFDLRSVAGRLPWPDLNGKSCLDVGTFDGFWAFEMERRGAAEVVAVDVLDPARYDWPAGSDDAISNAFEQRKRGGQGFELACEALGSSVERRDMSIYELSPEELGSFDLVYLGSLLLHLRDPVGALEAVRSVCTGNLLTLDAIDPWLSRALGGRAVASLDGVGRPWWWKPNEKALTRLVESAGFVIEHGPLRISMPPGKGQPRLGLKLALLRSHEGRVALRSSRRGDPHAAILARPA